MVCTVQHEREGGEPKIIMNMPNHMLILMVRNRENHLRCGGTEQIMVCSSSVLAKQHYYCSTTVLVHVPCSFYRIVIE